MRFLRPYSIAALAGMICGMVFSVFFYGLNVTTFWNGALLGACISLTITAIERSFFNANIRRIRFSVALVLRTLMQIIVITGFVAIGAVIYISADSGLSVFEVIGMPVLSKMIFSGAAMRIIFYALSLSFLINLIRQMSRILGQNVLLNIIVGKYSTPIEEERIFMFLDLDASTTLAERLGNIQYHELLDEYVYDLTKPILDWGGEIYQYVGDEIVVTWKTAPGKHTMKPIECFFAISKLMERLAPTYREKYGFVPSFKAGFHCGIVVTGEIGDVKKEIVFQGDVVNTASRIKETCSSLGAKILISRELLEKLPQKETVYRALRAGSFLLKGKEHETELFTVTMVE
ncbi:MAG: adenylate/guanylate cyclase domain-containing protein [bacterium]